ncbi:hypothetical protein N9P79_02055 [Crocinitomicaceae bacterium]|nr:hypothetical protein [Crocinitomicaceae bacterium]
MDLIQVTKRNAIDTIDQFEKKYIRFMPYSTMLLHIVIMSCTLGNFVRLYYNTWDEYLNSLFELSWYGLGWGNTPALAKITTNIICLCIGLFYNHYVYTVNFYGTIKTRRERLEVYQNILNEEGYDSDEGSDYNPDLDSDAEESSDEEESDEESSEGESDDVTGEVEDDSDTEKNEEIEQIFTEIEDDYNKKVV